MAAPQNAAEGRVQASHDLRRRFETTAYVAGGGIVIAVCTLRAYRCLRRAARLGRRYRRKG
jgi:hypothetical protein